MAKSRYRISPRDLSSFNNLKRKRVFKTIKNSNYVYEQKNQIFETDIVRKAKLILMKKFNNLYEEISCRKIINDYGTKESFAYQLDLWNPIKREGFEIQWHNKVSHDDLISRMKKYKELFGSVKLIFLQYDNIRGWLSGYKYFTEYTLSKYKDAGIKFEFMYMGRTWKPP